MFNAHETISPKWVMENAHVATSSDSLLHEMAELSSFYRLTE